MASINDITGDRLVAGGYSPEGAINFDNIFRKKNKVENVKLVWATPDIDGILAYIARVSNPANQDNPNVVKLINHMLENGHVSPFAMANVCLEVNSTRDIGRQMLRHYSLKPQEFSQRYQTVDKLGNFVIREFRLQDVKNRQSSIEVPADDPRQAEWAKRQQAVIDLVEETYQWCLANGGAKECARVVLPEGNTPTRMYYNGTIRDWIFFAKSRLDPSTQKEHRLLAQEIVAILKGLAPLTLEAAGL